MAHGHAAAVFSTAAVLHMAWVCRHLLQQAAAGGATQLGHVPRQPCAARAPPCTPQAHPCTCVRDGNTVEQCPRFRLAAGHCNALQVVRRGRSRSLGNGAVRAWMPGGRGGGGGAWMLAHSPALVFAGAASTSMHEAWPPATGTQRHCQEGCACACAAALQAVARAEMCPGAALGQAPADCPHLADFSDGLSGGQGVDAGRAGK
jgi:hypothetical protein